MVNRSHLASLELILVTLAILILQAENTKAADAEEIARMNFTELCQEFNQTCAEYEVTTEDGYIITVHRIIVKGARPILLWHGILDSSDTFIIRGFNSTSIALATAGYDVWLGNSRGNKYSRRHINLNPDKDKKKFWDFSFHEMGLYDMPATIDFILKETNKDHLAAIGHSQGTTMFYVLASLKPIYNEKVQPFISLAPIAFLTNIEPVLRDLIPIWPVLNPILELFGSYELLGHQSPEKQSVDKFCTQSSVSMKFCLEGAVMPVSGFDLEELEQDFYKVVSSHFGVGTSIKSVSHFVQIHLRKRFANFDNGIVGNMKKYGTASPPDYDLKKVNTSVVLLCGANDRISTVADVELLKKELPNVIHYKVMERKEFNHIDFVWGKNINVYLNPMLKEILKKYS